MNAAITNLVILQAAAVLDEARGNLQAAIKLAHAAIDHRVRDDREFDFRCDVAAFLETLAERSFQC